MDHLNQTFHPSNRSSGLMPLPTTSLVVQEPYYGANPRPALESADDAESTAGLLEYWQILSRHKKAIILAALAGLIVGFLVGIPMKPVYRARTSVEVLSLNEDFMNMKQSSPVSTSGSGNSDDTSEQQTQAKLLQSATLLKRVVTKLDPTTVPAGQKSSAPPSPWRLFLHLPRPVQGTDRQKLLNAAQSSLKIRPTGRTRLLEVTVDSTDPRLAANFTNTLVQEFIQQNLDMRWSNTQRTSEWLGKEIDDARTRLKHSEDILQSYARESGLIFTDNEGATNIATEKLQQVQQELSGATADRIVKQSSFELAKSSPPDGLADVLSDPGLRDTGAKITELRRQIADLSAVFDPEYSKIRRAHAALDALQAAFDNDRTDILRRVENDYQGAVRKEQLLSKVYDAQIREVSGQGEKSIQYNILKREVDSNRQLYDIMLQQTKQASVASAMRASNVRVVDPAEPPSAPVFPDFRINSALGLISGLFFSIVFVVGRERMDRTLQQPGDVNLWTDLPELGSIPSAAAGLKGVYDTPANLATRSIGISAPTQYARTAMTAVELMTWQRKSSAVAEAFRSTLTSIFFVGENGSRPRVLAFTSASPGDGKTTVVSNLAISTAEIHRRVLVVDADLRRPRMHEVFDLPNERGLTDLLREEFSERNMIDLIQQTSIPGLCVLTGGSPTQAAAHLLYSPNFNLLLDKLKEQYDMILIDTPPMLQMTDARVAGRLADAVVVVTRAGKTTRDSLLMVKQRFAEDRIRVLGTILNDWNPNRTPNGYYASYGARYYGRYSPNTTDDR